MSSRLLSGRGQVATHLCDLKFEMGSNLTLSGSKWVAGWVAGRLDTFWLNYAVFAIKGSKGSNFLTKLRIREKAIKAYIDNNRNNLLHLLPDALPASVTKTDIRHE